MEVGFFRTVVGSQATTSTPDLLIRYGFTPDFELRLIGLTYGFAPGSQEAWLDPSVGFKYRLQRGAAGVPEITFVGQTTVAIGASSLRANATNPTGKIAWTMGLGKGTVGGNLVYGRLGSAGSQFNQGALSFTYSQAIDARLALTGEVWAVDHYAKGAGSAAYGSIAGTYLINNDTQLDLRVGSGFNERRDGWFIQGGISFRF